MIRTVRFVDVTVPESSWEVHRAEFTVSDSDVDLLSGGAHGQKSQPKTERRNVAVEVFQVLGLPVNVHEAVLLPKDGGYVLRCRMSNESSSEISGLRYVLTRLTGWWNATNRKSNGRFWTSRLRDEKPHLCHSD